ncbi:hypothetical protein Ccrd_007667 [Cynara cardunculus var. scolymus]|uniref:Uncharacterized protein n=1 Tax=Cynara cardunculus var. scolymus TaxID=59895 RepID=A0A103XGL0_CYNCS|nr:hypothetical protein Ccrd_007667 [Cynara cardunculus var. scolymus]
MTHSLAQVKSQSDPSFPAKAKSSVVFPELGGPKSNVILYKPYVLRLFVMAALDSAVGTDSGFTASQRRKRKKLVSHSSFLACSAQGIIFVGKRN